MENRSPRPFTVDLASWLLWAQVIAGLGVSILVVVFRHQLDKVWSPMESDDRLVRPIEFVPVILVLYGVIAILMLIMIHLFRGRHLWAQHGLGIMSLGILMSTLATMRTDSPPLALWSATVAGVAAGVSAVFVWHPQTSRFIRRS